MAEPDIPYDVDNNRGVSPSDVLLLINDINNRQARPLPLVPDGSGELPPYLDVSGDNSISATDVLMVINYLNLRTQGEGESTTPYVADGDLAIKMQEPVSPVVATAVAQGIKFECGKPAQAS